MQLLYFQEGLLGHLLASALQGLSPVGKRGGITCPPASGKDNSFLLKLCFPFPAVILLPPGVFCESLLCTLSSTDVSESTDFNLGKVEKTSWIWMVPN